MRLWWKKKQPKPERASPDKDAPGEIRTVVIDAPPLDRQMRSGRPPKVA